MRSTGAVHPLLLMALSVPWAAQYSVQVQSWTPTTSSQTLMSVTSSLTSVVTISIPRSTSDPVTDVRASSVGEVRIRVGPISIVAVEVQALLDVAPPEPVGVRPARAEVGLVESRALIEAIRLPDSAVLEQLAVQFDAVAAVPLLRLLAATMEAGFRMHVYAVPGRPLRAIEWFQAPTGEWVTLRLIPARDADGVVSAESLTDDGRVEIVRQRRSVIVAESVAVVSAMVKEFADVG